MKNIKASCKNGTKKQLDAELLPPVNNFKFEKKVTQYVLQYISDRREILSPYVRAANDIKSFTEGEAY